jgi:hypothetical protein
MKRTPLRWFYVPDEQSAGRWENPAPKIRQSQFQTSTDRRQSRFFQRVLSTRLKTWDCCSSRSPLAGELLRPKVSPLEVLGRFQIQSESTRLFLLMF